MNKALLTTSVLATAVMLTACGQESYTTDYLYEYDDVRATVLAECKENKQTDDNCKNANEANDRKAIENFNESRRK